MTTSLTKPLYTAKATATGGRAGHAVSDDGINGEPSDADSNDTFRAAYPEYFAQPGAAANLLHQRFRRAREDVKALLQAVVRRDELT